MEIDYGRLFLANYSAKPQTLIAIVSAAETTAPVAQKARTPLPGAASAADITPSSQRVSQTTQTGNVSVCAAHAQTQPFEAAQSSQLSQHEQQALLFQQALLQSVQHPLYSPTVPIALQPVLPSTTIPALQVVAGQMSMSPQQSWPFVHLAPGHALHSLQCVPAAAVPAVPQMAGHQDIGAGLIPGSIGAQDYFARVYAAATALAQAEAGLARNVNTTSPPVMPSAERQPAEPHPDAAPLEPLPAAAAAAFSATSESSIPVDGPTRVSSPPVSPTMLHAVATRTTDVSELAPPASPQGQSITQETHDVSAKDGALSLAPIATPPVVDQLVAASLPPADKAIRPCPLDELKLEKDIRHLHESATVPITGDAPFALAKSESNGTAQTTTADSASFAISAGTGGMQMGHLVPASREVSDPPTPPTNTITSPESVEVAGADGIGEQRRCSFETPDIAEEAEVESSNQFHRQADETSARPPLPPNFNEPALAEQAPLPEVAQASRASRSSRSSGKELKPPDDARRFLVRVPKPYPGVQYRKSRRLDDRHPLYAMNNSIVTGVAEDDNDWLKVWKDDEYYGFLPMRIGADKIILPIGQPAEPDSGNQSWGFCCAAPEIADAEEIVQEPIDITRIANAFQKIGHPLDPPEDGELIRDDVATTCCC